MAPEQVTGAKVDARSDIFSFGSMLYEMLTGRRAFRGATAAETIGEVLGRQPTPPREIVPDLPIELEQVVLRCLRKEPERRFQSIADVRVVLQDIADARVRPTPADAPVRDRRLSPWLAAGLAAGMAIAAASAVWWQNRGHEPLRAPRLEPLTTAPGIESSPTFSPDGLQFAFASDDETPRPDGSSNFDLWVRLVGGTEARRITADQADELAPSWSPDGRWIAYLRGRVGETPLVHVVSPLGGAARPLAAIRAARIETELAARRAGLADHLDAGQPPRRLRPRRRTAGRHRRHRDRAARRRRAARPDLAGGAPGAPRPGVLARRNTARLHPVHQHVLPPVRRPRPRPRRRASSRARRRGG